MIISILLLILGIIFTIIFGFGILVGFEIIGSLGVLAGFICFILSEEKWHK